MAVHVLIGFAEALPAPEVVFSLLAAGHRVSVFARAPGGVLERLPLITTHVIEAPERDTQKSIDALRAIMTAPDAPDMMLPLDDFGLWLSQQAGIAPEKIAGATAERATAALDKRVQVRAALAVGLSVPATQILSSPQDLAALDPATLPQVGIAKPALAVQVRDGAVSKGDVLYINRRTPQTALEAALDNTGALLIQPLVSGVGEGVFGFATGTGVTAWSGHRRVRMVNPHGSGSSACERVVPDADLREKITAFLQEIGWRGAFMIELLRDSDGTPWFMELNGRMWGSLALARRQGFEYPAWAVEQTLSSDFQPTAPTDPADPGTLRHFARDLLHLALVVRGPKSAFHRKTWPSFWRSAVAVLKPARRAQFYNYDPKYPAFMWHETLTTLKSHLKR